MARRRDLLTAASTLAARLALRTVPGTAGPAAATMAGTDELASWYA